MGLVDDCGNHLFELLPRRDRAQLLADCEDVPLTLSQVLFERDEPARDAWFPHHGFISLITQVDEHPGVEVGMVGREGVLGAALSPRVQRAPWRALVQGSGGAWRIDLPALRRQVVALPTLRLLLDRYQYVLTLQLASSAACLRYHLIAPRLARWLLLSHDRARSDSFHVTHEFLAYMLGVRRVGITTAAGTLQRAGLIRYHRGELEVMDRAGLEAASCSCYAANQRAYAEQLD